MSQDMFSQPRNRNQKLGINYGRSCSYEIIQGKRSDCKLLHSIDEKQLYVKNKTLANGSTAYTCKKNKTCYARVYICGDKCYFSEPFYGHHHGNCENEIEEMKTYSQIKSDCGSRLVSQTTSQVSDVREIFEATTLR